MVIVPKSNPHPPVTLTYKESSVFLVNFCYLDTGAYLCWKYSFRLLCTYFYFSRDRHPWFLPCFVIFCIENDSSSDHSFPVLCIYFCFFYVLSFFLILHFPFVYQYFLVTEFLFLLGAFSDSTELSTSITSLSSSLRWPTSTPNNPVLYCSRLCTQVSHYRYDPSSHVHFIPCFRPTLFPSVSDFQDTSLHSTSPVLATSRPEPGRILCRKQVVTLGSRILSRVVWRPGVYK